LPGTTSGSPGRRLAPQLAPDGENAPAAPLPADLARVVRAWPDLPEHIRAAVLALVTSAR
jgi:hypothetical protein